MTASRGFVVPAGGGKHVGDNEPDRFSHLKLLTDQTNGSISDVRAGGATCAFMPRNVPHAWKNCGSMPGRVRFLYTPAHHRPFRREDDGRAEEPRGTGQAAQRVWLGTARPKSALSRPAA